MILEVGDPGGIRTHDHSIKSRVLYQLSYGIAGGRAGASAGRTIWGAASRVNLPRLNPCFISKFEQSLLGGAAAEFKFLATRQRESCVQPVGDPG